MRHTCAELAHPLVHVQNVSSYVRQIQNVITYSTDLRIHALRRGFEVLILRSIECLLSLACVLFLECVLSLECVHLPIKHLRFAKGFQAKSKRKRKRNEK
jgi:hypothetical protein